MGLSIYNCGSLLNFCGFSVCYLEWGGVPQVMAWYQVSWPVLSIPCAEVEQCDRFFENDLDDILYMFSLTLKHSLKKHRNHWFFYLGISYWEYLVLGEGMTFTRYIEVPVHLTVTSGILHASLIACFGNLPKMLAWMPSCVWWSIVLARCKHICTVIWLI
jgi:hypothetical protein